MTFAYIEYHFCCFPEKIILTSVKKEKFANAIQKNSSKLNDRLHGSEIKKLKWFSKTSDIFSQELLLRTKKNISISSGNNEKNFFHFITK